MNRVKTITHNLVGSTPKSFAYSNTSLAGYIYAIKGLNQDTAMTAPNHT